MSDMLMTAPNVLVRAAEILAAQGWTQDGGWETRPRLEPHESPLDVQAAIAMAAGLDILDYRALERPTGVYGAAVMLLARHVLGEECPRDVAWALARVVDWQDEPETTLEEVLKRLRDAAVVSTPLRAGQLYAGREGDLLYVVLPSSGGELVYVTVRGTQVSQELAQKVYAPLTLLRAVGAEAPAPAVAAAAVDRPVSQEKGALGDYARAVARALRAAGIGHLTPRVGVEVQIAMPGRDAVLTWHHLTGWRLHRVAEDGAQADLRYLHGGIALRPREVAGEVGVWLRSRDWLSVEPPSYGGFTAGELDDLLGRAAKDGAL